MSFLRRKQGFSLVEVVAATAILLLAVLAISGIMMTSLRATSSAGEKSVTTYSLQEEMEKAISDPDYEGPEGVTITREPNYVVKVFGASITGTLITIEQEGSNGRETYVTFVADDD